MSDPKVVPVIPVAPEELNLSLLQQLVKQRDAYVQQTHMLVAQLQQLNGGVLAYNEIIQKMEQDALQKIADKDNQGEKVDGQANVKAAQQAAQK